MITDKPKRKPRRGQAIIELVASLIIFALMLTLVASISVYLYLEHALVTAAREGARYGSLDTTLGGNSPSAAITDVQNYVINFAKQTTNLTLTSGEVTVTPPAANGTFGQRSVRVDISHDFTNPLPINALLSYLHSSNSQIGTMTLKASATMRYEE